MIKEKVVAKILKAILKEDIGFKIEPFPYEESKGYYKNVFKIITAQKNYVLKKAKENELDIYKHINNSLTNVPYFYGDYHYYGSDYILLEYVSGKNAMIMNRNSLIRIIDAIINTQKKYWLSNETFGTTKEQAIKRYLNRLYYLPDELKEIYQQFIECFKEIEVTFSHEDLLPFNLIINKESVYFLDFEVGGILPYPTMMARLIAHTDDDKTAKFYLKKEDFRFAISYYYSRFIKEQGIKENDYLKAMNLFIFNELIEWIYVYQKNGYKPNEFYSRYYQKALNKKEEILKLLAN